MKLHYFQHVPFEGLGCIKAWAERNGAEISSTVFYEGNILEPALDYDMLIVMGGPMNVDEEGAYPWLKKEKEWIKKGIAAGKKVFGVCLGAQLVASALGAKVYKNSQKEIGWFPVQWTDKAKKSPAFSSFYGYSEVFHWHGDTFELPEGCERAAKSAACLNQAFFLGDRVACLQFHLETTPQTARLLVDHCAHELVNAPFIQEREKILAAEDQFQKINEMLFRLLDGLWTGGKVSV